MEIVGVAEPIRSRREAMREQFHVPEENCFSDWSEILARPKMADAAIISTQDQMHYEPAMRAIELGYHLLLEKPISNRPEECVAIAKAAEEKGVHVIIGHVLRYAPFFTALRNVIASGRIGKVVNIDHVEGVGDIHYSHSFVRGSWHREEDSAPMLLAKSCHDFDLLQWLIDKNFTRVQSFGSQTHFCKASKPEGAPKRCIEGCPYAKTCVYNAVKRYYDDKKNAWFRNAATMTSEFDYIATDEEVERALRETPYGYCVYDSDNTVVDHQTVNMEFEGGVLATFTMSPFNRGGRRIHVMGTEGEVYGDAGVGDLTVFTYRDRKTVVEKSSDMVQDESILGGHGGGDSRMIKALCELIATGKTSVSYCSTMTSARNHLAVFAAEESRHTGTVVDVTEYEKRFL
jgi:predicted dehydrogenase